MDEHGIKRFNKIRCIEFDFGSMMKVVERNKNTEAVTKLLHHPILLVYKEGIVEGRIDDVEEFVDGLCEKAIRGRYGNDSDTVISDCLTDIVNCSHKGMETIVVAHNLRSYDDAFILNYLRATGYNSKL